MGLFDRIRGGDDRPRVAFLGVDGVPYTLLADHPDWFPNFASLATDGASGPIDSIVPPESSACWPALTTGVNPGKTGVYGFQDREADSYETYVPMGGDVAATRVWDRVTEDGRDATVLNVPVTFPPQRNVQRMVSGFLAPDVERAAATPALERYLTSVGYRVDVDAKLGHDDDKSAFVEDAHATLDARYEAFAHYVDADDWDLFFGVFMTTDRVNHFLFGDYENGGEYREEFVAFYRKVDRYVGAIRDALADDVTLLVASDHGFTSEAYEVDLNAWLEREGWLSYRADDHDSLADVASDARTYSLIPGRLYLNLEGREPRGCVAPADYESVRDELTEALESLESPEGEPVVDRVVAREEAFSGAHDEIAPDLVAIPNHGFDLKAGFGASEDVFRVGPRNGMHSFENATLYADDPTVDVEGADILDVAPTMLDLMDVDYDRREFDGRSLV